MAGSNQPSEQDQSEGNTVSEGASDDGSDVTLDANRIEDSLLFSPNAELFERLCDQEFAKIPVELSEMKIEVSAPVESALSALRKRGHSLAAAYRSRGRTLERKLRGEDSRVVADILWVNGWVYFQQAGREHDMIVAYFEQKLGSLELAHFSQIAQQKQESGRLQKECNRLQIENDKFIRTQAESLKKIEKLDGEVAELKSQIALREHHIPLYHEEQERRRKALDRIMMHHEEQERRKREEEAMLAQAERQAQAAEIEARRRREVEARRRREVEAKQLKLYVQNLRDRKKAHFDEVAELEKWEAAYLDKIAKLEGMGVEVEAVPQKSREVEQDGGNN